MGEHLLKKAGLQANSAQAHAFTYPLFMAFLDVDRIPELCRVSPFLSYGRWNWAAFHEEDQFGDPALPLRETALHRALGYWVSLHNLKVIKK